MRIWGITGTNGKTTTAWVLAEFINASAGRKCGYITTVEVNTGSRCFYTGYTTPPLVQLKEILSEMEANGCTDCVMEMSSHAIHQHRTGNVVFAGGAFTNLSEDHLDYHRTMEAYFDVKLDFARQIAAANAGEADGPNGALPPYVVCLDGGYGREMLKAVSALQVRAIPVANSMPDYDLAGLQLIGGYNRSNVLTAAALAEAAGISHEDIQRMIPTLQPRWGRLEYVSSKSQARVYVDFAHTPDGLEKMLAAVRGTMQDEAVAHGMLQGSLWVVFGAGGDRDPMKRPLMGGACAQHADRLVVTSDNPRSEDPMAIIDAILSGISTEAPEARHFVNGQNLFVEPDRRKAIHLALRGAKAGDVVVIAGKGHETTQEIKGIKYPFSDRKVVEEFF